MSGKITTFWSKPGTLFFQKVILDIIPQYPELFVKGKSHKNEKKYRPQVPKCETVVQKSVLDVMPGLAKLFFFSKVKYNILKTKTKNNWASLGHNLRTTFRWCSYAVSR
jgi:hypothetical protein